MIPVKVGNGKEIHKGYCYDSVQKGRITYYLYKHLCGSGKSSNAHNFRKPDVKPTLGLEITCKKCLEIEDRK